MSEAESHQQDHPYHMVDPSPWPAFGALGAGTLAMGAVLFMHDITSIVMYIGLVLVLGDRYVTRLLTGAVRTTAAQGGLALHLGDFGTPAIRVALQSNDAVARWRTALSGGDRRGAA